MKSFLLHPGVRSVLRWLMVFVVTVILSVVVDAFISAESRKEMLEFQQQSIAAIEEYNLPAVRYRLSEAIEWYKEAVSSENDPAPDGGLKTVGKSLVAVALVMVLVYYTIADWVPPFLNILGLGASLIFGIWQTKLYIEGHAAEGRTAHGLSYIVVPVLATTVGYLLFGVLFITVAAWANLVALLGLMALGGITSLAELIALSATGATAAAFLIVKALEKLIGDSLQNFIERRLPIARTKSP